MPVKVIQMTKRGMEVIDDAFGPCINQVEAEGVLVDKGWRRGADGDPKEWVCFAHGTAYRAIIRDRRVEDKALQNPESLPEDGDDSLV